MRGLLRKIMKFLFCAALAGIVHLEVVALRPQEATVTNVGSNVVYNITYDGSTATHILWEKRYGALFAKDAAQTLVSTTANGGSSSLTLPQARDDVLVHLKESERSMTGCDVYFKNLSQSFMLPELQVQASSDVIHFPNPRLTVNVTVISSVDYERRFLVPEFTGVQRNATHSKIVHIPSYTSTLPLTKNEIGRNGNTISYEVIPPDVEGLLIIHASLMSEVRTGYPWLMNIFSVENVPSGNQGLFEESVFGVSVENVLTTGWFPCASNLDRCIIDCVAIGTNVESIELYFENMTRAYTTRQDIRHKNKYMKSRFVFDDVTKGEKGRLTCQASDGSLIETDSFDMIVHEGLTITETRIDHIGNEMVYRCSATGYPKPVFHFTVDEDDEFYKSVPVTEDDPVDDVYSATYTWPFGHTLTTIRCRVVNGYSADWSTLDL